MQEPLRLILSPPAALLATSPQLWIEARTICLGEADEVKDDLQSGSMNRQ